MCQGAHSVHHLEWVKQQMSTQVQQYVASVGTNEEQFQCAAVAARHQLFCHNTTNVAEAFNKDAKQLRSAKTEFALIQGLVELAHDKFHITPLILAQPEEVVPTAAASEQNGLEGGWEGVEAMEMVR